MNQTQSLLPKIHSLMGRGWFGGKSSTNGRWLGCRKLVFFFFVAFARIRYNTLTMADYTIQFSFILNQCLDSISLVLKQTMGSVSVFDFLLASALCLKAIKYFLEQS